MLRPGNFFLGRTTIIHMMVEMKNIFFLLTFSCLMATVPAQEAKPVAPPPALPPEKTSPVFDKVSPHVELGGRYFSYEDYSFLTWWAGFFDRVIALLPPQATKGLPKDFSVTRIADDLGITRLKAVASSSRAVGPLYHNRSFYYLPEGRKGIFTIYGGEAKPYTSPALAPADTDLVLEFDLNVKDASQSIIDMMKKYAPEAEREQLEGALQAPIPGLKFTLQDILAKSDAHFAIMGRMDEKKRLSIPESGGKVSVPTPDTALVIDGMGWFLEEMKGMIVKQMNGKEPFTMKTAGDVTTFTLKMAVSPPPLSWQPVIRFEGKSGRLIVASDAKFMAGLISKEARLQTSAGFKSAMLGLPEQGNSLAYVSPRLQKELRQLMYKSLDNSREVKDAINGALDSQPALTKLMGMVMEIVLPDQPNGLAIASANLPDGILVASNLQFSLTGSLSQALTAVGIGSSLALPAYTSARGKAQDTQAMSNAKQVGVALQIYAADNGKFPATLDEVAEKELITKELLKCVNPVTGESEEWIYNKGLKPGGDSTEILLAAPFVTPNFMRIVVYTDGSVASISEEEFTAKMKKD